jgi:hypothetical protein
MLLIVKSGKVLSVTEERQNAIKGVIFIAIVHSLCVGGVRVAHVCFSILCGVCLRSVPSVTCVSGVFIPDYPVGFL